MKKYVYEYQVILFKYDMHIYSNWPSVFEFEKATFYRTVILYFVVTGCAKSCHNHCREKAA
jgi:hypothetical protein